ncbi:MAG: phosphoenolpyruvate synthase, partial [Candidatus Nealsonbacteria bacterium]
MKGKSQKNILWFKDVGSKDVSLVGGKNASLGEMYSQLTKKGIAIPSGFALTSRAYLYYLKTNKIDKKLKEIFKEFNPDDLKNLEETGRKARELILKADFPSDLKKEILREYGKLSKKYGEEKTDVAVRSSATAEDLASASFAGQHESYLNISGEEDLLSTIKKCLASLFNDRAIAYREEKGFEHLTVYLSVGVQKMVRSDLASAGVMFTLDTETGFQNVVLINSIYGLGELIVKGKITPDEFYVFKPTLKQGFKSIILKNLGRKEKKYIYGKTKGWKEVQVPEKNQLKFSLTDKEVLTLASWACKIEEYYKLPQDIEWAKDGKTGQLFVVQSRPETVHTPKTEKVYFEYKVSAEKNPVLKGIAIGDKIGIGKVRMISDVSKISEFKKGEVLVTKMTDPDWVPAMRIASAIVTEEGGKTAHAAIVSRELGIPAIVGTKNAIKILKNGQLVTVDCTQGLNGRIYSGKIPFEVKKYNLKNIPR